LVGVETFFLLPLSSHQANSLRGVKDTRRFTCEAISHWRSIGKISSE